MNKSRSPSPSRSASARGPGETDLVNIGSLSPITGLGGKSIRSRTMVSSSDSYRERAKRIERRRSDGVQPTAQLWSSADGSFQRTSLQGLKLPLPSLL